MLPDNPHLVYAMIRSHRRFEELANFTLGAAVAEIRRVRASRPELKSTLSSTSLASITDREQKPVEDGMASLSLVTSPSSVDAPDEPFPVRSEKARGKMRARSLSVDGGEGDPGDPGPYTSRTGFVPTESCR